MDLFTFTKKNMCRPCYVSGGLLRSTKVGKENSKTQKKENYLPWRYIGRGRGDTDKNKQCYNAI